MNEAGKYAITGNTVIDGGTMNFNGDSQAGSATLSRGALSGTAALRVTGAMSWTGGTMSGLGSTVILGELAISGVQQYLSQRTLDITGTATIADQYSTQGIYVSDGGSLVIEAGGSFTFLSDCVFYAYGGTPAGGTIVNRGIFAKTGGNGTSTISTSYGYFPQNLTFTQTSTGKVQVSSGELAFNGGGGIDGALSVSAAATLGFSGGTFAILASSSFSGAGNSEFSGGTVNEAGTYAITGNSVIDGGTVNFNGDSQTGSATLSRGALSGTAALTVTGAMSWTGGTMSGLGSTVILGELAISGVQQYLSQRTLDIVGTATIADQYASQGIYVSDGGSLVVEAGGSFTFLSDCVFYAYGGTPAGGTIVNRGIFAKTGGNGTSTISTSYGYFPQNIIFNEEGSGRAVVTSGTLSLDSGGSSTGSSGFSALGGGKLVFPSGTTYTMSGSTSITGDGVLIRGATVVIDGSASATSLEFDSGEILGGGSLTATNLTWVSGVMAGDGQTTVTGILALPGNADRGVAGRTLNTAGTFDLTTAAPIYFNSGTTWNNSGQFSWEGTGAIHLLGATWSNTGTITLAGAGALDLLGSSWSNANILNINGPGPIQLSGGSWSNSGTLNLVGTSPITAVNTAITNSGTTTWNGLGAINLVSSHWSNSGALNWSGSGLLGLASSSLVDNLTGGTLNVSGVQPITGVDSSPNAFHNAGHFIDAVSSATLVVGVPWTNSGTISVEAGSLSLPAGGTSSAAPSSISRPERLCD